MFLNILCLLYLVTFVGRYFAFVNVVVAKSKLEANEGRSMLHQPTSNMYRQYKPYLQSRQRPADISSFQLFNEPRKIKWHIFLLIVKTNVKDIK